MRASHRRGFAIVDLLGLAGCCAVAGAVGMVTLQQPQGAGGGQALPGIDPAEAKRRAMQLKDATQVRGIHQAMVIWAQNNQDQFPLPSRIDVGDATVRTDRADRRDKDTTANIMSVMIFNGMISPELCVSPAEVKASIKPDADYAYDMPQKAAKPEQALWDPSFGADFQAGDGNVSYAHAQPSRGRLADWSSTFQATMAQVGARGPEIAGVDRDAAGKVTGVRTAIENSNTLRMFGAPDVWEGNIAYADNHTDYVVGLLPPDGVTFHSDRSKFEKGEGSHVLGDVLFWDEPEDLVKNGGKDGGDVRNTFLGIFTKAGDLPKEFKAIWD